MKLITKAAALALLLAPAAALAQGFAVGQRVTIGSTGDTGTIIEVGTPLADGGTMIKVHLDRLGPGFPQVGAWYDTAMSRVTVTAAAGPAPKAPAAAPPPRVAKPAPAPKPAQPDPAIPDPPGTTASAAVCKQLIVANYPPTGADQTITVNFLQFSMGAPRSYVATYANDNNGIGHTVRATPVHAKYTVLTHFDDPQADDQLRTYDAQFMCYKSAAGGGWVVEMVSRLPGGETAQYIKKTG